MRNVNNRVGLALFALLLITPLPSVAATAVNTVVNQDVNKLTTDPSVPPEVVNTIQDNIDATAIDPEVTIPAAGGVISGTNVLLKGIATPNSEVDILVQSSAGNATPLVGKTVSDKYGVWTDTLGPQLADGNYTVRASTQSGSEAIRYSDLVSFSVADAGTAGNTSSGVFGSLGQDASQPFVIIILAIIFSITLVATMLVWAMVSYLKASALGRQQVAGRMELWEEPQQFAGMNERQWHQFVNSVEKVRGQVAHAQ